LSIPPPSDNTAKLFRPTSIPVAAGEIGKTDGVRSTEKPTYQWLTSRWIVTVLMLPSTGR
jgi:hypothetical protein